MNSFFCWEYIFFNTRISFFYFLKMSKPRFHSLFFRSFASSSAFRLRSRELTFVSHVPKSLANTFSFDAYWIQLTLSFRPSVARTFASVAFDPGADSKTLVFATYVCFGSNFLLPKDGFSRFSFSPTYGSQHSAIIPKVFTKKLVDLENEVPLHVLLYQIRLAREQGHVNFRISEDLLQLI